MTKAPDNFDKCAISQEALEYNSQLEWDIRRLQSMILAVDAYYEVIYERHCDSPGFEYVHSHLSRAVGDAEELLMVLPEDQRNLS